MVAEEEMWCGELYPEGWDRSLQACSQALAMHHTRSPQMQEQLCGYC